MTTPPPSDPTVSRPSVPVIVAAHTESLLNEVGSKLAALVFGGVFGYLTFLEAKSAEPSNLRLALCAVPTFFALAMLCTDLFVSTLTKLGTAWKSVAPQKWGGA